MAKTPLNMVCVRLRSWGKERFGTMAAFAKALRMKPPSLNDYLKGKTLPGNALQAKLREMGCDIEWLITGVSAKQRRTFTEHEEALLKRLEELGVYNVDQLNKFFLPENLAKDIALVIREKLTRYNVKRKKK